MLRPSEPATHGSRILARLRTDRLAHASALTFATGSLDAVGAKARAERLPLTARAPEHLAGALSQVLDGAGAAGRAGGVLDRIPRPTRSGCEGRPARSTGPMALGGCRSCGRHSHNARIGLCRGGEVRSGLVGGRGAHLSTCAQREGRHVRELLFLHHSPTTSRATMRSGSVTRPAPKLPGQSELASTTLVAVAGAITAQALG